MPFTVKKMQNIISPPNQACLSPGNINSQNFDITRNLTTSKYANVEGVSNSMIIRLSVSNRVSDNEIELTAEHMSYLGVVEGDSVTVERIPQGFHECFQASKIRLLVYNATYEVTKNAKDIEPTLSEPMVNSLTNSLKDQVLYKGQIIGFTYLDQEMKVFVDLITLDYGDNQVIKSEKGAVGDQTNIIVDTFKRNTPFPPGVNPDKIGEELKKRGIGGMEVMIKDLINSIFKTKYLSPRLQAVLKARPTKGVLFHGPPGTGKTLVARNLCEVVLCVTPQVINGPELTAQYFGESEKNIRDVFAQAKSDYELYGKSSPLHVFIFDEFDSVGQKRKERSDNEGNNRMVAQLLTLLDGVAEMPNILVLATTNRLDAIDPALLRPGRIEKKVYVKYPTEEERVDILKLKIEPYSRENLIDEDVDVAKLADLTEEFSGADLEAVVSGALVKVLECVTFEEISSLEEQGTLPKVSMEDFARVIEEIKATKSTEST